MTAWRSLSWFVGGVEWELTCGFCRVRVRRFAPMFAAAVVCPGCGTRNRLSSAGPMWRRLF